MEQRPVCLSIGGSDPCGGAGIQADLRVFSALQTHGCSAISALTAQNPGQISHIQASSILQFEAEIKAVTSYYAVAAIKTGMLYDAKHLQIVTTNIGGIPLVVDPVLIASSGQYLFEKNTAQAAYEPLIRQATLWTPNQQEAAFFLGKNSDDSLETASALLLKYKTPILLKGGHGEGEVLRDIFCDLDGTVEILEHPKQQVSLNQSHGTGCRLASAITAYLARGNTLLSAICKAHHWLQSELQNT